MLQFLRSLLRQSNPSMRTATGLSPDFIRTHPPLRADNDDGGAGKNGAILLLLPNCSSWITGFDALLGGDPQKNGGDEASWLLDLSSQFPLVRRKSRSSDPAWESPISDWLKYLKGLMESLREGLMRFKRRGFGHTTESTIFIPSQPAMAFCS